MLAFFFVAGADWAAVFAAAFSAMGLPFVDLPVFGSYTLVTRLALPSRSATDKMMCVSLRW